MKYALLVSKSYTVLTFRQRLIKKLIDNKNEIIVIAHDNVKKHEIEKLGVKFYYFGENNRGVNPFASMKYVKYVKNILKKEKVDVVFTFQAKPNVFGVRAAHKAGIKNILSMVEGAGDVFYYKTLKWKIIRLINCILLKSSFKYCKKVFFLNEDDLMEFVNRKILNKNKCALINGIGVDIDKFKFKEFKKFDSVLMVSRLVQTKGVYDYIKVASVLKKRYPALHFLYLGPEGDIKIKDIQNYIDNKTIEYLGMVDDVRPYIEESFVFILPSYYREGLPMSIMEAEAIGRPIITTNNYGCKSTVINNYNGFLVDCHDVSDMIDKIEYLYLNNDKCIEMGKNSRRYAVEKFSSDIINDKIIDIINEVL